jgi:HEAT repeat protein
MSDASLILDLAVPHRARRAYAELLRAGPRVLPLVRANLEHPDPRVRAYCCKYLDHFVVTEALGELLARLRDPDPEVRAASLHALACDRCKTGDCRPDEGLVLPLAMQLLATDPDAHVRAHAAGVVGLSVHARPEAAAAVRDAIARDPSPAVRKKARWFAPGGPIYRRTLPRAPRKPRPPPAGLPA